MFDHALDEHPHNLEDSKISHAYQVLIYKCSSGLLGTQPILQSVSRDTAQLELVKAHQIQMKGLRMELGSELDQMIRDKF